MTRRHGWTVLAFASLDSTQAEAKRRLAAGERLDRTVVRAARQEAGVGRFGRAYASPEGGSWQTFVAHDPGGRARDGRMPARAAARVADALATLGAAVALKWPNDVWTRGPDAPNGPGKVGGLLLEHHAKHLLIGVGLNATNAPPPGGASLGLPADDVSDAVVAAIAALLADPDATDPSEAWRGRHLLDGRVVDVAAGHAPPLRGRVAGIAADGGLRLVLADGTERVARSGSVVRIDPPLVPTASEDRTRDARPTDAGAGGC